MELENRIKLEDDIAKKRATPLISENSRQLKTPNESLEVVDRLYNYQHIYESKKSIKSSNVLKINRVVN